MQIAITAIVTFIITVVWQKSADRKNKLPLRVILKGMRIELEILAQKAGYQSIFEYWEIEKGKDYAQVAQMNFDGALRSLE
ncbi:hypothetical protein E4K67_04210 [Desulfosporosinus fructosivorans]|uniref:Uncharacterized protein n=1 Tax=Desulfosporosinus fructosivorans TaxID=2018669 RepID=A0A4Z0R7C8_9FIRM|nr:hypothetical protein [Desulfosporosinus fructosivorans]TGE38698.1 hypothetical protein E4K67_04210 [Desulfosporosinus fructosivorans]